MDMSNDFFAKRLAAIEEARARRLPAVEPEETAQTRVDQLNRVISADGRLHYKDALDGASRQGNCGLVACRGRRAVSVKVDGTNTIGQTKGLAQ